MTRQHADNITVFEDNAGFIHLFASIGEDPVAYQGGWENEPAGRLLKLIIDTINNREFFDASDNMWDDDERSLADLYADLQNASEVKIIYSTQSGFVFESCGVNGSIAFGNVETSNYIKYNGKDLYLLGRQAEMIGHIPGDKIYGNTWGQYAIDKKGQKYLISWDFENYDDEVELDNLP